ncbi:hypothetical protein VitviT2T_010169 [Vitis vinifera]|uniref:Uncharacterized protein n=1 Tax=Vitis vinifera TaxID=29760 RepID=A0ABY9C6X5_VITVI|nr:hypothetical protein VitviT2T_010169 [Vitis vinifera]
MFHLAFRATISSQSRRSEPSAFRIWRSEPLFLLSSAFRAIIIFHLAFRATISSQSWHSEPSTFFTWHSEPLFLLSLGVQGHQHVPFGFQIHYFFSVSAFRAINIFHLAFRATISSQSRRLEPSTFPIWYSEPLSLLGSTFRAISIFHLAFDSCPIGVSADLCPVGAP